MSWFSLKVKAFKILRVLCSSRQCSGSGINLLLCALANLTPAWAHICAWSMLNLVSSQSHWCSDASSWLSMVTMLRRQPFKAASPAPPHKCQPKRLWGQSIKLSPKLVDISIAWLTKKRQTDGCCRIPVAVTRIGLWIIVQREIMVWWFFSPSQVPLGLN